MGSVSTKRELEYEVTAVLYTVQYKHQFAPHTVAHTCGSEEDKV
jgi:hypothetical protein